MISSPPAHLVAVGFSAEFREWLRFSVPAKFRTCALHITVSTKPYVVENFHEVEKDRRIRDPTIRFLLFIVKEEIASKSY